MAAIREISRVSKPGRRVYVSAKSLPQVANGLGISILSTLKALWLIMRRVNRMLVENSFVVFSKGCQENGRKSRLEQCLVLEKTHFNSFWGYCYC